MPIREFFADIILRLGAWFFPLRSIQETEVETEIPADLCQNAGRMHWYRRILRREVSTPRTLIRFGKRLMWLYGVHPHFFEQNTLQDNARYLTLHALILPQENPNPLVFDHRLSDAEILRVLRAFERRIAERIPVEYITQEAQYLGNKFYVNEHVLVPRSLMNTRFADFIENQSWSNRRVLDLCTGSGCIGISLALLNPDLQVDLADLSPQALQVATQNIQRHGLQERVRCIQGDLFENIQGRYDLIISNPPYVTSANYRRGPAEFKNEPRLALEAGADGLTIVRRILQEARSYLNPSGKLIVEVGFPAAKRLKRYYRGLPLKWYPYRKPNGKTAFLAMDCVLECEANHLPRRESSS